MVQMMQSLEQQRRVKVVVDSSADSEGEEEADGGEGGARPMSSLFIPRDVVLTSEMEEEEEGVESSLLPSGLPSPQRRSPPHSSSPLRHGALIVPVGLLALALLLLVGLALMGHSPLLPVAFLQRAFASVEGVTDPIPSPVSAVAPPLSLLPSCTVPAYGPEDLDGSDMNLEYIFGLMLDFLPSTCGCAIRPRLYSQFQKDYVEAIGGSAVQDWAPVPDSSFPMIWIISRYGIEDTSLLRFCYRAVVWCQHNVIAIHVADEHRWSRLWSEPINSGEDIQVVPYHYFHSVFRQYHMPHIDDYSYLAYDMLRTLGYTDSDLTLIPVPFNTTSVGHPNKAEAETRIVELTGSGYHTDCPLLATPLMWSDLTDVVLQTLTRLPDGGSSILTPSDMAPVQLAALHAQLGELVNGSRVLGSPHFRCHTHSLLSFYLRSQADTLDYYHEKANAPPDAFFNMSSTGRYFGHVYWIPLGHTPAGMPSSVKSGVSASSSRELLWSWSGSVKENKERVDLQNAVTATTLTPRQQAVKAQGTFFDTLRFAFGFRGIRYTAFIANAVFMPIPAGNVAEQYRLHEVLEAGTFPMLVDTNIVGGSWLLSWLRDLALDPVPVQPVQNFTSFFEATFPLQFLPFSILDPWQAVLHRRYQLNLISLRRKVAIRVCEAARRPISKVG